MSIKRFLSTARIIIPDLEVDNLVIGAGVVGLAIGDKITRERPTESTFVVEKHKSIGQETSSRNSEVIHAGIYYPEESLKTKLCIQGNRTLYPLLEKTKLPYKKLGKWIVAQDEIQAEYLIKLHNKATRLNVPTYFLDAGQAQNQEPHIRAHKVLVSPSTGILDSHAFMSYLEQQTDIALATKVQAIRPHTDGYLVQLVTNNQPSWVLARRVFNSAGLHAHKIAQMLGLNYKIHFVRGNYYRTSPIKVNHLIYPCPERNLAGLGTHLTLDLAGQIKFGPDVEYIHNLDYSVPDDQNKKETFANAIQSYLPELKVENIYPDYSGIRPKLSGPGEPFKDFIIKEESDFKNFFTLMGIESPGLTSSLAIADYVYQLIRK